MEAIYLFLEAHHNIVSAFELVVMGFVLVGLIHIKKEINNIRR